MFISDFVLKIKQNDYLDISNYKSKKYIIKMNNVAELLTAECKTAWASLLAEFAPHCCAFRGAAAAIATLDCLQALATVAQRQGYCRPVFLGDSEPPQIAINQGRAPVLDAILPNGAVPNDVALHSDGLRTLVINGPNMGGKSCCMRLVAQTVLLAQIGSWVPAASVTMRVVDSILTRMGASDNILQVRVSQCCRFGRNIAQVTPKIIYFKHQKIC